MNPAAHPSRAHPTVGRRPFVTMQAAVAVLVLFHPASWAQTLIAGDEFKDCRVCPEMVVVPKGHFLMGSPVSERLRGSDEGLVHPVRIRSFAVGKYEVTFGEWDACYKEGGCPRIFAMGRDRGRNPASFVTWHYAKAYVGWISEKTGQAYRLLSEAEWEYVARAGSRGPFSTGETISPAQANYDGRYRYLSRVGCDADDWKCLRDESGLYRNQPLPVGSFAPNAFGLHDVHGNVWEWVEDCYGSGYWGAPEDGSARLAGSCEYRILRGGAWHLPPWEIRSAARYAFAIAHRNVYAGFRVARALDQ